MDHAWLEGHNRKRETANPNFTQSLCLAEHSDPGLDRREGGPVGVNASMLEGALGPGLYERS